MSKRDTQFTVGFKAWAGLLGIIALASACSMPVMRFGRMPDLSRLESALTPHVSTRADVLAVLGTPRNSGQAMMPTVHDYPRDLWVYYYEQGNFSDDRRMFLFIFLDQDRYDGYLLFSSLAGTTPIR